MNENAHQKAIIWSSTYTFSSVSLRTNFSCTLNGNRFQAEYCVIKPNIRASKISKFTSKDYLSFVRKI